VSKLSNDESPDFSALSNIMDYFNKVPFEIFKRELNEWFYKEFKNSRPDLLNGNSQNDVPPEFKKFIEAIFKLAEEKDHSHLN